MHRRKAFNTKMFCFEQKNGIMVGRTNLERPTALRLLDFQIELLREIKLDFFYHFVRRETETPKSALTIQTLDFFLFTGSPSDTGRLNNSITN